MLRKIFFLPEQASSMAGEVDSLYLALLAVTAFFSLLIGTLVLGFAVRYRRERNRKATQIEGNLALEILWSGIPFIIAMGIFLWSAKIYLALARPPDDALPFDVLDDVTAAEILRDLDELPRELT